MSRMQLLCGYNVLRALESNAFNFQGLDSLSGLSCHFIKPQLWYHRLTQFTKAATQQPTLPQFGYVSEIG